MCTAVRFTDDTGELVFGRNLDWSEGYGEKVLIVPRNFKRTWKYAPIDTPTGPAIIGMGVVADNLPLFFDCANEAGLAVAGLNFPGWAQYAPAPIPSKTNVCAYEVPFWIASNFQTVDEAEVALKQVAIVGEAPDPSLGVSHLHWMIADKTRSICVEYTKDGMQIFSDNVDVLTNQPGFLWHQENARNYMNITPEVPSATMWDSQELKAYGSGFGMRGLPADFSSPSRFVRAAYFNSHYPAQAGEGANVTRLFKTLGGSAMIKGGAKMENGNFEFTVYTGGYAQSSRSYYYATYDDLEIHKITLSEKLAEGDTIVLA